MFRYVVLGLLRDGMPRHGYALMKRYRQRTGHHVSTGNFYRELQRLADAYLVRMVARAEGADARQSPYVITDDGASAFDTWMSRAGGLVDVGEQDDQLSARIPFLPEIDPDDARRLIRQWQDDLWLNVKNLERERDTALSTASDTGGESPPVLALLLGRRLRHLAASVAFLEDLSEAFKTWGGRAGTKAVGFAPRPEPKAGSGVVVPRKRASAGQAEYPKGT